MSRDTSPVPEPGSVVTELDMTKTAAYERWRNRDQRRFGVMARHAFFAGWAAAEHYAKGKAR